MDQGPHFTSKIIKQISEALGIRWQYHPAPPGHPQSSRQVERINQTLKVQLSKLMLETKRSWVKCLPLALLKGLCLALKLNCQRSRCCMECCKEPRRPFSWLTTAIRTTKSWTHTSRVKKGKHQKNTPEWRISSPPKGLQHHYK